MPTSPDDLLERQFRVVERSGLEPWTSTWLRTLKSHAAASAVRSKTTEKHKNDFHIEAKLKVCGDETITSLASRFGFKLN